MRVELCQNLRSPSCPPTPRAPPGCARCAPPWNAAVQSPTRAPGPAPSPAAGTLWRWPAAYIKDKCCAASATGVNSPRGTSGGSPATALIESQRRLLFSKIIKLLSRFYSNFSKIGTSDSERGRIFQRFSRSTRFSHFFPKIMKILLKILRFSQKIS